LEERRVFGGTSNNFLIEKIFLFINNLFEEIRVFWRDWSFTSI